MAETMDPVASLFDPSPIVLANDVGANAETVLPILLQTNREPWSYVLRFQRCLSGPELATAVLIRVAIHVKSGSVGVGCLNVAETEFIDETIVQETTTTVIADIVVARPADAGPLIVRNASAVGSSEVSVFGLDCFALEQPGDTARRRGIADPRPCPNWNRYYGTRGDTVVEKLRVQAFEALATPEILRSSDGLAMWVLPGDQLSRALYVSGTYEPNTLCVLRRILRPGDTFIDVGANTGVLSLIGSIWVGPSGHVYSFEPSRREFEHLQDNLALNVTANVTPLSLAVTAGCGSATLRVAPSSHAGLNTLGADFSYGGVDTYRLEPVETVSLDAFVERQGITSVAAIKMDVEGAEAAVVQGAAQLLRAQRPVLIIEVFSRSLEAHGSSRAALEGPLKQAGYRLYAIDDETASLMPIDRLTGVDEQNVIALPEERDARFGHGSDEDAPTR